MFFLPKDHSDKKEESISIKRICIYIFIGYLALAGLFYFFAGRQLHFRESRGNLIMLDPEIATAELSEGRVIEQHFYSNVQILEKISVRWSTFYRKNHGLIHLQLIGQNKGEIFFDKTLDASQLKEGEVTELYIDKPIEGLYGAPLVLRITSDSAPGEAVALLLSKNTYYASISEKDKAAAVYKLLQNGRPIDGMLCMSVLGEDHVWTGLHYIKLVVLFGSLLLCYLGVFVYKAQKGKKNLLYNIIWALKKYRFLIEQLVLRDFKTKYKRSVLGVLWSFLNPLMMLTVQYLVFSTLFKPDIKSYQVYLLIGIVLFNFFSEASNMTLTSIVSNASLITKVYIPKYIYPLTRVLSSSVNLLISLVPLLFVVVITGTKVTKSYFLLPFVLVCLIVFCLGLGMFLSSMMVFFRDTQFLWGVISTIWMYATPIFYPASIIPKEFLFLLNLNPLYYFISFARTCIIDGVSPEITMYLMCAFFASSMLLVGGYVFKKAQDRFILNL